MNIKQILIILFIALSANAFSQKKDLTKRPDLGAFMLETDFNPFGSDEVISFNNLQTKLWVGKKTVLRFGLIYNQKKNELTEEDYKPEVFSKPTLSEKSVEAGIKPGIEFRLLTQNRIISPYIGLEAFYINRSAKSTISRTFEEYDYQTDSYRPVKEGIAIDGAMLDLTRLYDDIQSPDPENLDRAYNSFGGSVIFGSDFYFISNLYFGFEVSFGYSFLKYQQITIDYSDNPSSDIYPSSSTGKLGLGYNSLIRLGIWF